MRLVCCVLGWLLCLRIGVVVDWPVVCLCWLMGYSFVGVSSFVRLGTVV